MEYNKDIPLDISSIFKVGIESWYKTFDWPIKWTHFLKLENDIKDILNKHIKENPHFSDLIIINYKIFVEYSSLIYSLKIIDEFGSNALISKDNVYMQSLAENQIPNSPIISFPNLDSNPNKGFKPYLRRFKNNIIDNNFSLPRLGKDKIFILMESRSLNTLNHIKSKYNGRICSLSFFDFYNSRLKSNKKNHKAINCLVKSILDDLINVSNNFGVELNLIQKKYLLNHTLDLFTRSNDALINVIDGLGDRKINLYLGCNNNYYSRILSVAIRKLGGKIHGFKHGEPINYLNDLTSWLDLSLCDYWYEYDEKSIKIMNDIIPSFPPPNNNKFEIRSMKKSCFDNFFQSNLVENDIDSQTIILIGNRYRNNSFSSATAVFPTLQFYIELTIIKKLQKKGFKVIYKIHPGNTFETRKFFNLIKQSRNKIYDSFDIDYSFFKDTLSYSNSYAFYYTGTTTFGEALISGKSIYLFDYRIKNFPNTIDTYIKNRCVYQKINYEI